MQAGIYRLLGIEEQEKARVFFLVVQSVFLGVFYGAFDIGAHALFLNTFGPSMLPIAFLISGLAGMILTTIYTYFQKRISFSRLSVFNLLTVLAFILFIRSGFQFIPERGLIFFFFIMMGPLNIIALLGFWGTAGRLFGLRQGKRLFGLVDLGQVIGVIISSYAIPLILTIGFQARDTLVISAFSVMFALVLQVLIGKKFDLETFTARIREQAAKAKSWISMVLQNRYIVLMALFVVLSMISAFFVHYTFLAVTNEQYASTNELANFLGLFNGSMMVFIILVKTFVYSRLLKTYGLKVSLALSPVLLGIFTLIAVAVGSFFGYTVASASFTLFFLAIAMSKLFSKALKDSIEAPSFKLLYQSLDAGIRHDIQARIDGTINETAAVISGLILTALGALHFFRLIHFSMALLLVLLIWFFVALALYRRYKLSLNETLAAVRQDQSHPSMKEEMPDRRRELVKGIAGESDDKLFVRLSLASFIHPEAAGEIFREYIRNGSYGKRQFAVGMVEQFYTFEPPEEYLPLLEKELPGLPASQKWVELLSKVKNKTWKDPDIVSLAHSRNPDDRQMALSLIRTLNRVDLRKIVLGSFRDLNPRVVKEAVYTSLALREETSLPYITELLAISMYNPVAFYALCGFGPTAIEHLEQVYHKAQTGQGTKLNIVRIYGCIGGEKAIKSLLSKINENDLRVVAEVVRVLNHLNYQAGGNSRIRISQLLETLIGIVAWNYAACSSLDQKTAGDELKNALEDEVRENIEFIYLLLSLLYDRQTIQHIRENLESGAAERTGFAMELMEQFIAEELKPTLYPVLDDFSVDEKYRQLEEYLPIRRMETGELLIALLNRGYNFISLWTKACALEAIRNLENWKLSQDLVAQLFNPDPMLRQSAAILIHEKSPSLLEEVLERKNDDTEEKPEEQLENILTGKSVSWYNLVIRLREQPRFKNIPGALIYLLAKHFVEVPVKDYPSSLTRDPMVYLASGNIEIESEQGVHTELTKNSLSFIWDRPTGKPIKVHYHQAACLFSINENEFKKILFDEILLARILLVDETNNIFDKT